MQQDYSKEFAEYMRALPSIEKTTIELPVPKSEFEARIKRCQRAAAERLYDGLIVYGSAKQGYCIDYLTNYWPSRHGLWVHHHPKELRWRGSAILVIGLDGEPTLVQDDPTIALDELAIDDVRTSTDILGLTAKVLEEKNLDESELGFVESDIAITLHRDLIRSLPKVTFYPADDIVENMRAVLSPREQELVNEAVKIADRAMEAGLKAIEEGKTEEEIANVIWDNGGRNPSVLSGPRWSACGARFPEYTSRRIRKGELILIDTGGVVPSFESTDTGYNASIDRSTAIAPTAKQKEMLELCAEALETMIRKCKVGMKAEDLEKVSQEFFSRAGYERNATMSFGGPDLAVGHGTGLGRYNLPRMAKGDKTTIKNGMGLCFEPALYVPGIGGARIEDTVIVAEEGCKVLTKLSRVWW